MNLNDQATQTAFGELVGASQQAVSKHVKSGTLELGETYATWLKKYCAKIRDEAAGRGGSEQESLARAKIDEAGVKTALGRLEYNKKLGELVLASEVEIALNDWAGYSNREYKSGSEKLIQKIEGEHRIVIDREMVTEIVGATAERIQSYAEKLGEAIGEGS